MANIIGIDISDSSIEAVVLSGNNLAGYSRFRLSPDIVSDGRIIDQEKLKDALKKLLKNAKPKPIEAKSVFLSVPESKVYSHIISLPKKLKDKDLKEAAKNKAGEMIPEDPDNLISISKILPETQGFKEVFQASADATVIKDLVKVFKDIGLEVEGITSEAISSYAGLSDKQKKQTTLMLDIGSRTTIASVFNKNGLVDTINIGIAGHNITTALVAKLGISYDEAEDKKRNAGLDSGTDSGEVMMIIQGQLQPLTDEIKKFINYQAEAYGRKIEKVILIGGLAGMRGIDKYFGDNLSIPTEIGQAFIEKSVPADFSVSKYINALGLAKMADSKEAFNFYTREAKKITKVVEEEAKIKTAPGKRKIKKIYIILPLIILILGGAGYYYRDFVIDFAKNKVMRLFSDNNQTFSQDIVVGTGDHPDIKNYLAGEYFEVMIPTEQVYPAMSYDTIVESLQAKETADIIAEGYIDDVPPGYYLIPEVVEKSLLSFSPPQEEFKTGDLVNAEMSYKFVMFPETSVKELMLATLSQSQSQELADWIITDSQYAVIKYEQQSGHLFNIKAIITLQRP